MKYFIDTEFIEGFRRTLKLSTLKWRKQHFIDLISIAIVCEDGRTLYNVSREYKYAEASQWVKDNVIVPLYTQHVSGDYRNRYNVNTFHRLIGFTNKQIASNIIDFVAPPHLRFDGVCGYYSVEDYLKKNPIEFYGYYADYDWVLLCSLFGTMMQLPKGFPMYCNDLKQTIDEKARLMNGKVDEINQRIVEYNNFEQHLQYIKGLPGYPEQVNDHNALWDARWNTQLYYFLKSL